MTALETLSFRDQVEHLKYVIAELTAPPPDWFKRTDLMGVRLQPAEARILGLLVRREPNVVTHASLFEAISWDDPGRPTADGGPSTVRVHVHYARKKLKAAGIAGRIISVPRIGYRWIGDIAK